MPATILVSDNPLNSAEVMQELAPASFNVVLARPGSPDWAQTLPQADYLVGLGEAAMDDSFYRCAPKLKLIQLLSAGYDRVDIEAARRAGEPNMRSC
jgi:lactate dehydrogenase-like 2-hydroxyacid dehydrogenase